MQITEQYYKLSPNQEELWKSHYMSPGQNHLNMFTVWVLSEDVDLNALKAAFQGVLNKFATLRTSYTIREGQPVQTIIAEQILDYRYIDLSNQSREEFDTAITKEANSPFEIENGNLMKIRVYLNDQKQKVLLFNVHHLAIDGYSIMLLMKEFGELYSRFSEGLQAADSYQDDYYLTFVGEQRRKDPVVVEEEREHWTKRLVDTGGIQPVQLPAKHSLPHSYKGKAVYISVEQILTNALKEIAKSNGVTLYILLLSAFQLLLHKYSGQEHIWVATPYSRRTTKTLDKVGFYANTLYIDGEFDSELPFTNLVQQIAEKFQQSTRYKDITFFQLQQYMQMNGLSDHQLNTNIIFSFQNMRSITKNNYGAAFIGVEGVRGKLGNLEFQVYPLKRNTTQFEIELEGVEYDKGLHFRLLYDPEKYDERFINRFTNHFLQLLKEIKENTHLSIDEYQLLDSKEQWEQLNQLNYPQLIQKVENPFLLAEIEKVARKNPNSAAVSMGDTFLTYDELSKKSGRMAANLKKLGIKKEERIGLAVNKSVSTIPGILGILKAGAVYVPLDPTYPAERLQYMIKDAGISYIVVDSSVNFEAFDANCKFLLLEDLLKGENEQICEVDPKQLAYIIYTSGSTGKPKGVMVSHENIYYSMMARNQIFKIKDYCHFLLLSSISFDSSMVGIFWTLTVGGKVVVTDQNNQLDIPELLETLKKEKITHLLSVPTFVQLLLEQAKPEHVKHLQCAIVAGEQFPKGLHNYQREHFPDLTLINEYGPSEATVWSSIFPLDNQFNDSIVPIGFPSPHAKLYILDHNLELVPKGTVGEIYIAGRGITRGYNNRPSQTAETFIPNPFGYNERLYRTGDLGKYNEGGRIQFLGRIDGQVKINGFRIEIGEIETAIAAHDHVSKSFVHIREEPGKPPRIIAYIEAPDDQFSLADLKGEIGDKLPHYMMPHQFIALSIFPLTANGKVDTKKLRNIASSEILSRNKTITEPKTEGEKVLASIFEKLFGEVIGTDQSYFEIGGDSILAIQISSKALEKGWQIKPKDIFERRTIANMALSMKRVQSAQLQKRKAEGLVPLTPIQKWFFHQEFSFPNHWNQSIRLKVHKDIDFELFQQAFRLLFEVHGALRLRFFKHQENWVQKYAEDSHSHACFYKKIGFDENSEQIIRNAITELQQSLHITKGPLVSAAYFDLGNQNENEIVIAAHHLVIDLVSWQILLQDLDQLVEQLLNGQRTNLVPEASTYKDWSYHQLELPNEILAEKLAYWSTIEKSYCSSLSHLEKGTEGERENFEAWLDSDKTRTLLKEVPQYYGTKVNELVLAAVAISLKKFTNDHDVLIDIETHGREPLYEDIDLSRTVGWFTSVYPMFFEGVQLNSADGELLKYIKNSERRIPNGGVAYGIAKWLKTEKLVHFPDSLFSYNFLGKIDQSLFRSKYFSFHSYLSGSVKDSREKRLYLLEFEPYIYQESFCLRINYSPCFSQQDIRKLADEVLANILSLISFCTRTEEIGFVTNDFPDANLDQKSLDKFLTVLKQLK